MNYKRVKTVVTIGPACDSYQMLKKLILEGEGVEDDC